MPNLQYCFIDKIKWTIHACSPSHHLPMFCLPQELMVEIPESAAVGFEMSRMYAAAHSMSACSTAKLIAHVTERYADFILGPKSCGRSPSLGLWLCSFPLKFAALGHCRSDGTVTATVAPVILRQCS